MVDGYCNWSRVDSSDDSSVDRNDRPSRGLDCVILGAILFQYLVILLILSALVIRCCVIARRKRKKKQMKQQFNLSQNNMEVADGILVDYPGTFTAQSTNKDSNKGVFSNNGYSVVKITKSAQKLEDPTSSPGYSKLVANDINDDKNGNRPQCTSPEYSRLTGNGSDTPTRSGSPVLQAKLQRSSVFVTTNETVIQLNERLPTRGANRGSSLCPPQVDTQFTDEGSKRDSDSIYSMAGHGGMSSDNLTDGEESDAHYSVISRPSSVATVDSIYDNPDNGDPDDINPEVPAEYEDFYSIPNNDDETLPDSEVGVAGKKTKELKVRSREDDYCDVNIDSAGRRGKIRAGHLQPHPPPNKSFPHNAPQVAIRHGNLKAGNTSASKRPRSVSANYVESNNDMEANTTTKSFRHGTRPTRNNPYVNI